jgi:hypothetical protein
MGRSREGKGGVVSIMKFTDGDNYKTPPQAGKTALRVFAGQSESAINSL